MSDNLQYIDFKPAPQPWWEFSMEERSRLGELNRRITGAEDLDQAMDLLFRLLRPLCPCERIGLAFIEEAGERITARWARAAYAPLHLKNGYTEDLHGSSLERVLHEGRPRIINDLSAYLNAHPESRSTRLITDEGLRSSMTCPLKVDQRIVGLLFISSRETERYGRHQLAMFDLFAEKLSHAVEKGWRIYQLEAANRAYTDLLGFVSHELKNPVASLVTDGRLLAEGYLGPLEKKQQVKVERMIAKGEFLLSLVRKYLDLARIESGRMEADLQPCDDLAGEVLEPAVDIILPQAEEKQIRFERTVPDAPVPLTCDRNLIKIVLINLLGNAVKYGREKSVVQVTVTDRGDEVTLAVRNEGPGFTEQERSRLFRRFSRLNRPELLKQKGSGIGLYTTWKIVHLHGGTVHARSEPGRWAEFSFILPRAPASEESQRMA